MKKLMILGVALVLMSMTKGDGVITKENGFDVVNTTTLAKNVSGYRGTTPLKIYIKKNKIERIEALKNRETPEYFQQVENAMFPKWKGMTVKKALSSEVDCVTGATLSSRAVQENVKRGLEYYQMNK